MSRMNQLNLAEDEAAKIKEEILLIIETKANKKEIEEKIKSRGFVFDKLSFCD